LTRLDSTHSLVPLNSNLRHTLALEVGQELVGNGVEDTLETGALGGLDCSLVGHVGLRWIKR
jgi:hypothetical protein